MAVQHDRGYLSYLKTGLSYGLAGAAALFLFGAISARRRLKPKNNWNNPKTLEGKYLLIYN